MRNPGRKIAFVLAASDHGSMIVNRMDYHFINEREGCGVGLQILESASYDANEVDIVLSLLSFRRQYYGDGVVALDCGANIGVHTIEWAMRMTGWGAVLAFEAQERVFYALAGNIALNNCFNARAVHAAVGASVGTMKSPVPNYLMPGSFGSLELKPRSGTEFIGQPIDYSDEKMCLIPMITIDSLELERIDLIKMDIEGMELEAIEGCAQALARHRPILVVESIKCDAVQLRATLERFGYRLFDMAHNVLAVHETDKTLAHLNRPESRIGKAA
jgi:FkbM family methyltransferase